LELETQYLLSLDLDYINKNWRFKNRKEVKEAVAGIQASSCFFKSKQ